MTRELLLSANDGDLESMAEMAKISYDKGEYAEAFYWLLKCAKRGDAWAMFEVSKLYRYGIGVVLDVKKSNKWLKRAVRRKNVNSIVCYADNLLSGLDGKRNCKKALRLYKRAYKMGSAQACYSIGNCFFIGRGTKKDLKKAKKFFEISASNGNLFAKWELNGKSFNNVL